MRKKSRAMDSEWALEVMHKAPYITVSFIDEEGKPYGLPLSLASDDDVNWYFHGALEGKKLEAIKAHPEVCLSAITRCAPTVGPKDGSFTLQFKSAIAFGKAEIGLGKLLHLGGEQRRPAVQVHVEEVVLRAHP